MMKSPIERDTEFKSLCTEHSIQDHLIAEVCRFRHHRCCLGCYPTIGEDYDISDILFGFISQFEMIDALSSSKLDRMSVRHRGLDRH